MLTVTWKSTATAATMAMQTTETKEQFMAVVVEVVAAYERGACQGMEVGVGLGAATLEHC